MLVGLLVNVAVAQLVIHPGCSIESCTSEAAKALTKLSCNATQIGTFNDNKDTPHCEIENPYCSDQLKELQKNTELPPSWYWCMVDNQTQKMSMGMQICDPDQCKDDPLRKISVEELTQHYKNGLVHYLSRYYGKTLTARRRRDAAPTTCAANEDVCLLTFGQSLAPSTKSSDGLSTGAIVGIGVGSAALVIIGLIIAYRSSSSTSVTFMPL